MKEIVIDVETSALGPKGSPSWYYSENYLVLFGAQERDGDILNASEVTGALATSPVLLIGHHLAFDIGWLFRAMAIPAQELRKPNILIWDTMVAEYLLRNQNLEKKSLSLKNTAVRRGLCPESWSIEEIKDVESIPRAKLISYNRQDLSMTWELYNAQIQEIEKRGLSHEFFITQMQARKLTISAEIRGLPFDVTEATLEKDYQETIRDSLAAEIESKLDCDLNSPKQLSTKLFGGKIDVTVDAPVLVNGETQYYKSGIKKGKIKTRKEKVTVEEKGVIVPMDSHPKTSSGYYSVDSNALSRYDTNLIERILKYRDLQKAISTYYEPFIQYAGDSIDGRIHAQLNHTVTATGRLSSSRPNIQNITNRE